MKIGDWIVSKDGEIPPGRVTCVNSEYVIFEVFDATGSYETHKSPQNVRIASKQDFDRYILRLNADILKTEELIEAFEKAQKEIV